MTLPAPPCPNCGCESCDIYSDTFGTDTIANYTQVSGSWAVSSGQLDPPATGLLKVNDADPGTGDGVNFSTTFTAGSSTGTFYWIIDYVDADNYHYAAINVTGSTTATIRIGKRTSGADTDLVTAKSVTSFSWSSTYPVFICTRGGLLGADIETLFFGSPRQTSVLERTTLHGGDFAALRTASVGSSARFDALAYKVVSDDCERCKTYGCTTNCIDMPLSVSLTFSNVNNGTYCAGGDLNQTFVVDYMEDNDHPTIGGDPNDCLSYKVLEDFCAAGDDLVVRWFFQNANDLFQVDVNTDWAAHPGSADFAFASADLGTKPFNCAELGTLNLTNGTEDCVAVINP
jgi:hypothetical protein